MAKRRSAAMVALGVAVASVLAGCAVAPEPTPTPTAYATMQSVPDAGYAAAPSWVQEGELWIAGTGLVESNGRLLMLTRSAASSGAESGAITVASYSIANPNDPPQTVAQYEGVYAQQTLRKVGDKLLVVDKAAAAVTATFWDITGNTPTRLAEPTSTEMGEGATLAGTGEGMLVVNPRTGITRCLNADTQQWFTLSTPVGMTPQSADWSCRLVFGRKTADPTSVWQAPVLAQNGQALDVAFPSVEQRASRRTEQITGSYVMPAGVLLAWSSTEGNRWVTFTPADGGASETYKGAWLVAPDALQNPSSGQVLLAGRWWNPATGESVAEVAGPSGTCEGRVFGERLYARNAICAWTAGAAPQPLASWPARVGGAGTFWDLPVWVAGEWAYFTLAPAKDGEAVALARNQVTDY